MREESSYQQSCDEAGGGRGAVCGASQLALLSRTPSAEKVVLCEDGGSLLPCRGIPYRLSCALVF